MYQPEYSVPFTSTDTVMLAFPLVEMLRDMSCGFSSAGTKRGAREFAPWFARQPAFRSQRPASVDVKRCCGGLEVG